MKVGKLQVLRQSRDFFGRSDKSLNLNGRAAFRTKKRIYLIDLFDKPGPRSRNSAL